MSEIRPAFTYSPEGVLTVVRKKPEVVNRPSECGAAAFKINPELESRKEQAAEWLASLPGTRIENMQETEQIAVPVKEALEKCIRNGAVEQMDTFVSFLSPLMTGPSDGRTDEVLKISRLHPRGLEVEVHRHFQRWLNREEWDRNTVQKGLEAMALPFNREKEIAGDFIYLPGRHSTLGQAIDYRTVFRKEQLEFKKEVRKRRAVQNVSGYGNWRRIELSSQGKKAQGVPRIRACGDSCIPGADGKDSGLYAMASEGISRSKETLSLLLGLGSFAYAATQYEGSEDVFFGVQWEKSSKEQL